MLHVFGELVRVSAADNSRLFPASASRIALKPADNAAAFAKGPLAVGRPGYSYHDYWYQVNDGDGSFAAAGRFDQSILVNPKAGLTIVKFSSYPDTAARATGGTAQPASAATGTTGTPAPLTTAAALNAAARAIALAIRQDIMFDIGVAAASDSFGANATVPRFILLTAWAAERHGHSIAVAASKRHVRQFYRYHEESQ